MADILAVREIAFHHQIVLAGSGVNLGNALDILCCGVGDPVGLAELTFNLDENRLHGLPTSNSVAPFKPPDSIADYGAWWISG